MLDDPAKDLGPESVGVLLNVLEEVSRCLSSLRSELGEGQGPPSTVRIISRKVQDAGLRAAARPQHGNAAAAAV
eukprot:2163363-Alexandrium_andersonii.AAC.1